MDESGDSTNRCGCDSIADEFVVRACACPSPPATYGERAKTAIAFAFNADFARVLQAQMVSRGNIVAEGWVAGPVRWQLGPAVAGCGPLGRAES